MVISDFRILQLQVCLVLLGLRGRTTEEGLADDLFYLISLARMVGVLLQVTRIYLDVLLVRDNFNWSWVCGFFTLGYV